jgi:hypothetical protein
MPGAGAFDDGEDEKAEARWQAVTFANHRFRPKAEVRSTDIGEENDAPL